MILRTYVCGDCNHTLEVELRSDQWDQEPPECPCCSTQTVQEFRPPAIGGSYATRAADLALDIAEKDYGVADIQIDGKAEGTPKVRYKDQSPNPSTWGVPNAALEQAVAVGRQTRLQHGSALDVIKTMPDLIELSKRRSAKVW